MLYSSRFYSTRFTIVAFTFPLISLYTTSCLGHGTVHEKINLLTEKLEANPHDVAALTQRGGQYMLDQNWDAAYSDFCAAASLEPLEPKHLLRQASALQKGGWNHTALFQATRYLRKRPNHVQARMLRAKIHAALGHVEQSVSDFDHAIRLAPVPNPELYVSRATTLLALDKQLTNRVLQGLDDGLAKLGSVPSLQMKALEIESKRNHFDNALQRVDSLLDSLPGNKDSWLVTKAELLLKAGQEHEAQTLLRDILSQLQALPSHTKNTRRVKKLLQRLHTLQQSLDSPQS